VRWRKTHVGVHEVAAALLEPCPDGSLGWVVGPDRRAGVAGSIPWGGEVSSADTSTRTKASWAPSRDGHAVAYVAGVNLRDTPVVARLERAEEETWRGLLSGEPEGLALLGKRDGRYLFTIATSDRRIVVFDEDGTLLDDLILPTDPTEEEFYVNPDWVVVVKPEKGGGAQVWVGGDGSHGAGYAPPRRHGPPTRDRAPGRASRLHSPRRRMEFGER
jgi:hypothetical protein